MKRDCDKAPALKLLPYAIRENLPILGSQQSLGGQAKVLARWSTADCSRAWYVTEGSARRDQQGRAVDYLLFGMVVGQGKQLDYFWLSDFVRTGSLTNLLVQRDLHWRPKTLKEIAPEMFQTQAKEMEN
jgi:hypothetical protein